MSSPKYSSTVCVEALSYAYDTASAPLLEAVQFEVGPGWTGLCGANGCGKSTLLQLIAGRLIPNNGSIRVPGRVVLCEQRTDFLPLRVHEFVEDYSAASYRIRVDLGIEDDWIERWDTLSHGERKRVQLGTAMWQQPEVLLLDEPTNHLDESSMLQIVRAIQRFQGIGMIVTHDRGLLDALCGQCLWFETSLKPELRNGGYSEGRKTLIQEQLDRERDLVRFQREQKRLRHTVHHYRREACNADRKGSNKGIDPGDR